MTRLEPHSGLERQLILSIDEKRVGLARGLRANSNTRLDHFRVSYP